MSEHDTHYKTQIDYTVGDHASASLGTISRRVASLGHGVERLSHKFGEFRREQNLTTAAMLGVGFGLGAWIEKAKEANGEFYRTKKGVTSILDSMLEWPKGLTTLEQFNRASALGAETTEQLEDQSLKFAMSLDEVGSSYKTLAVSLAPYHLSQERVMALNEAVAASAKRFGMDGAQAAEVIGRAILTKTIRPVGLLGKYLRNEVGGSLKKLNQNQILDRLGAALQKQVPAAELMSQGIGDVLSRIRGRVDKAFRLGTSPLFKEVAKYLSAWDKKLESMLEGGKIAAWGDKLVGVFKQALQVSDWLHEHWKGIAAIWGGMQLATAAGGIGRMATGLAGTSGIAGTVGTLMGSLGKFGMSLGAVTVGLGALYLALNAFSDWADKKLDKQMTSQEGARAAVNSAATLGHFPMGPLSEQQTGMLKKQFAQLHHAGVLDASGLNRSALKSRMEDLPLNEKQDLGKSLGLKSLTGSGPSYYKPEALAEGLASKMAPMIAAHPDLLPGYKAAQSIEHGEDKNLKFKGKVQALFTGPISIHQSFEDVDPDRVWIATKRGIEAGAERRVQSAFIPNFGST